MIFLKETLMTSLTPKQKTNVEEIDRTALDVLKDIQKATREAWATGDFKATLIGLELEGRHLGMFTDQLEHSGVVETGHSGPMSAAECEARALQAKIDLERIRAERGEQYPIPREELYVDPGPEHVA